MFGRIKTMKLRYKIGMGVATGAAVVGAGSAAFAYFTSTGSGSGTGAVGSTQALTIHQGALKYNGPGNTTALVPGDTATASFTVDNPGGNEYLNKIHLASWSSDKPGCDSTSESGWITMSDVTVANNYAHGDGQSVTPTGTITFNDLNTNQDVCQGAAITFSYTSN